MHFDAGRAQATQDFPPAFPDWLPCRISRTPSQSATVHVPFVSWKRTLSQSWREGFKESVLTQCSHRKSVLCQVIGSCLGHSPKYGPAEIPGMTLKLAGTLSSLMVALQYSPLVPGELLSHGRLEPLLQVEALSPFIPLGLQHIGPLSCPLILCHLLPN